MSQYPEQASHSRDKVKVILDLTIYATKKLDYSADVYASDLVAKNILLEKLKYVNQTLIC